MAGRYPDHLERFQRPAYPTLRQLDGAVRSALRSHPSQTISRAEMPVVADIASKVVNNSARPNVTRDAIERRIRGWVDNKYVGDAKVQRRFVRYANELAVLRKATPTEEVAIDTRELARTLVEALPVAAWETTDDPQSLELVAGCNIVTAIKPQALAFLGEFGVLNIFQTGSSGGARTWSKRLKIDRMNSGTSQLGWHPAELHPKSTYVTPGATADYLGFRDQYGGVLLEYRSSVRQRVTFTDGDSLDGMRAKPMRANGSLASALECSRKWPVDYVEGQVWGALGGEEVAAIYVPRDLAPELHTCLAELQSRFGMKVFTYVPRTDGVIGFKLSRVRELTLPVLTPAAPDHRVEVLVARYRAAPANGPLRGAIAHTLGVASDPKARRAIADLLSDFPASVAKVSESRFVEDYYGEHRSDVLHLLQARGARARALDFVRRLKHERAKG